MDSRYKNRRVTILLVTLITLVVMTSCIVYATLKESQVTLF
jgi:hypothetical protein